MESSSTPSLGVASAILGSFFEKATTAPSPLLSSSVNMLLPTCKTLFLLIRNASTKEDAKYKTIKLSNKTIQKSVVQVPDALDVLAAAGFAAVNGDHETNNDCLVYTPVHGSHDMANCLCSLLQEKIAELEQQQHSTPLASISSTGKTPKKDHHHHHENTFLSDQERKERQKRAKAARKAQEEARKAEKRRWQEDKQDRRREQAVTRRREEAQASVANATTAVGPPQQVAATTSASGSLLLGELAASRRMRNNNGEESSVDVDEHAMTANLDLHMQKGETQKTANAVDASAKRANQNEEHHSSIVSRQVLDPEAEDELWKLLTANVSTCSAVTGIRDTSVFKTKQDSRPVKSLKRVYQEIQELSTSLPNDRLASIWVRFDEESPQFLRALITAPLGTPYAGGMFCFDVYIPNDYPQVPPKVVLLTTGGGRVRFGPNLYADGKVCLSLLGTWPGPKWSPKHSNLYQILVSMQGLILGAEQPYYLEPGRGGWEGNVRDGAYVKQGQTLSGKAVKSEVGVPLHIQQYNNAIRVGTVRFAMLETMSGSQPHLEAFREPIQIHFFCNRTAILNEVHTWPIESMSHMDSDVDASFGRSITSSPGSLKDLVPELQQHLSALECVRNDDEDGDRKMAALSPKKVSKEETAKKVKLAHDTMNTELEADTPAVAGKRNTDDQECNHVGAALPKSALKAAPAESRTLEHDTMRVDCTTAKATTVSSQPSNDLSKADALRAKIRKAASSKNFILAGQLQELLNRLEDLERSMQQAAADGNYIRAGRFQEQVEALSEAIASAPEERATYSYDDSAQNGSSQNDDFSDFDDGFSDDSMPGGVGSQLPASIGGLAAFFPNSYASNFSSGPRKWGTGSALNSGTTKVSVSKSTGKAPTKEGASPNPIALKSPPASSMCRLRFRLPQSATHLEDFARNAPLSNVYCRLESVMSSSQDTCEVECTAPLGLIGPQAHAIAPPLRTSGAWAQPQSLAGFTLLLSHPKREFNLEMHGTKTLTELGLVPSVTLTVMRCADRGLARRGEVESRLAQASGGAMDVDGLSYEGLLELTERVGAAQPSSISQECLDQNSTLLSPSELKSEVSCPICLGDYDPTDTNKTIRKLHKCGHLMHMSCLATWLGTKSSCPLCKSGIVDP